MAQSTAPPYQLKGSNLVQYVEFPMAAGALIFDGMLVGIDATGLASPIADTGQFQLVGMCRNGVGFGYVTGTGGSTDNTGGVAGAISVQIEPIRNLDYLTMDAVSPVGFGAAATSEVHTYNITGTQTGGTLFFQRPDTPTVRQGAAWNATLGTTQANIQTAIRALYTTPADTSITVTVTSNLTPLTFTVTYAGTFNGLPMQPLIVDASQITVSAGTLASFVSRTTAAVSQSWIDRIVYFTDDHTVALSSQYFNKCGKVKRVITAAAAGKVLVSLNEPTAMYCGAIGL